MYLHKENRELFRDAILLTSQKLNVSEDIVEKDYYVTILVGEVRNHRIGMGTSIAPAASLDVNVLELIHKICDEDFYKNDYKETTLKLISDSLTYERAKNRFKELAEKIFVQSTIND